MIATTHPTFWSSLKATIARHPAGAFLVFFYVTGWLFFVPPLLGASGFGLLPYDLPPQPSILVLTLVGLAGGAFLVTRIADGKDGVRELRSRYFTWRTGPQWYLLALFVAPLLLLVGAADPHVGLQLDRRLAASCCAPPCVLRCGRFGRDPDRVLSRPGRTPDVLRSRDRCHRRSGDDARQAGLSRTIGRHDSRGGPGAIAGALVLTRRTTGRRRKYPDG